MQKLEELEKARFELEKEKNERENRENERDEILLSLQIRKMRAEAEGAETNSRTKLLLTRKKLKEEGVNQEEIDVLFPLRSTQANIEL
jgi:hypothetical protein